MGPFPEAAQQKTSGCPLLSDISDKIRQKYCLGLPEGLKDIV